MNDSDETKKDDTAKEQGAAAPPHDTMRLWSKWEKTPASMTKQVTFGRKFTAISPYYQIRETTRAFGPMGEKWGTEPPEFSILQLPECVNANGVVQLIPTLLHIKLTVWFGGCEQIPDGRIHLENCSELISITKDGGFRVDDEAYKKLFTDTLTKALSYLGSGSDVFLGKYEDSRYIQHIKDMERSGWDGNPETETETKNGAATAKTQEARRPTSAPEATRTPAASQTQPQGEQKPVTGQKPPDPRSNAALVNSLLADLQFIDPDAPASEINAYMLGKFKRKGWAKPADIPRDYLEAECAAMVKRGEAVNALVQVYGTLAAVRTALGAAGLSLWGGDPAAMMELTDRQGVSE